MKPFVIDAVQFAACAGYAALLETNKHRLTSQHTWMQVVVGNSICLAFAGFRLRQRFGWTSDQAERQYWRSYIVGGLPVIAWQLWSHRQDQLKALAVLKDVLNEVAGGTERA